MAKSSAPFTNFTAGELSPKLDGRTDLNKYYNGRKKLQNFLTFPQGGVTRRPGTEFIHIAPRPSQSSSIRLIPFEFNVEQTYVLEFSNLKFRIYKDGAIVGDPIVEVTTEYTAAQLAALKFTQSADIMYIVHPSHKPKQIARTSDTAWTITDIEFRRGPFLDTPLDSTAVVADGRTGTVTITASATAPDSAGIFNDLDIGRLIKLHDGYAEITNVLYNLNYTNKVGSGLFAGTINLVSDSSITFNVISDDGAGSLVVSAPGTGAIGPSNQIENAAGTITADSVGIQLFISSNKATATVLENEDLREELMPSYTASTISFHEGDPDATGLAHNDFVEDSSGNFIEQGFKVGMRISASGSANIDIDSMNVPLQ